MVNEPKPGAALSVQDDLSPVERLAGAVSGWLNKDPRLRRRRFEPVELVLFCVIAGVTLLIVAGLIEGFAVAGSEDVWTLLDATTSWAQLPVALALLGSSLLAWYHNEHWCDELEAYLRRDEADQFSEGDNELAAAIEQAMILLLRRMNRSRGAVLSIGILAIATALAAVATLVGVLHSAQSYFGRSNWYVYVFFAAQVLAIVVPSLGTAVLSARAWGRSSYVLGIDETHSPVVDEQLACDES